MSRGRRRKYRGQRKGGAVPATQPKSTIRRWTTPGTTYADPPDGLFNYGHWVNHGICKKCNTKFNLYTWEELAGKLTCPKCKSDDLEMKIAHADKAAGELKRRRLCQKCRSIFIVGMNKGEAFCPVCETPTEEEEDLKVTGEKDEDDEDAKTCAACRGSGKNTRDTECSICVGSGKIYPEDEEDETSPVQSSSPGTRTQYGGETQVILSDAEYCSARANGQCMDLPIPTSRISKRRPDCHRSVCPKAYMKTDDDKWWNSGYACLRRNIIVPEHKPSGSTTGSHLASVHDKGRVLTSEEFCESMVNRRCAHHKVPIQYSMHQLCDHKICPKPEMKDCKTNWYDTGAPRLYRDHIPDTILRKGAAAAATRSGGTVLDPKEGEFCISLEDGWCQYSKYVLRENTQHVCRRNLCHKDHLKNDGNMWTLGNMPKFDYKELPLAGDFCWSLQEGKCKHAARKDLEKICLRYLCPKADIKSSDDRWNDNLPRIRTAAVSTKNRVWETETDFCYSILNGKCRHLRINKALKESDRDCSREICPKTDFKKEDDRWNSFNEPLVQDWKENDDDTKILILDDIKKAQLASGQLIICPNCGENNDNYPALAACWKCKLKLPGSPKEGKYAVICPQCKVENDITAKCCTKCGMFLDSLKIKVRVRPEEKEAPKNPKVKVKAGYPYHCTICETTVKPEATRCPTCGIFFAPEFVLDSKNLLMNKPKTSAEKIREHRLKSVIQGEKKEGEGKKDNGQEYEYAVSCPLCGVEYKDGETFCKSCKQVLSGQILVEKLVEGDEEPEGDPGFRKTAEDKVGETKLEEGHAKT